MFGVKVTCFVAVIVGLIVRLYVKSPAAIADRGTCPYCFGTDYCDSLQDVSLKMNSFSTVVNNLLSTKNVYSAYGDLMLKKLGSDEDFYRLDRTICGDNGLPPNCDVRSIVSHTDTYRDKVFGFLNAHNLDSVNDFKLCNGLDKFIGYVDEFRRDGVTSQDFYRHVWTILNVSVEPLILQMLVAGEWPVPRYLGSCGRLIVETYAGLPLNHFTNHSWKDRLYIAVQLLEAAAKFTDKHADFRFYLTDISPDNIAVDENLTATFVDLENMILTIKSDGNKTHVSDDYNDEDYAYSEDSICESTMSDHNYYSICKLLLSRNAPWPMMKGGLLHSFPKDGHLKSSRIFDLIEECVSANKNRSRFVIVDELIQVSQYVLKHYNTS